MVFDLDRAGVAHPERFDRANPYPSLKARLVADVEAAVAPGSDAPPAGSGFLNPKLAVFVAARGELEPSRILRNQEASNRGGGRWSFRGKTLTGVAAEMLSFQNVESLDGSRADVRNPTGDHFIGCGRFRGLLLPLWRLENTLDFAPSHCRRPSGASHVAAYVLVEHGNFLTLTLKLLGVVEVGATL